MPNPTPGRINQAMSLRHARSVNFNDPRIIALLSPLLVRDYYSYVDNFDNESIANNDYWSVASTGAGAADPVLSTALSLPTCVFTTGGGDPGVSTLHGTTAIHQSADNPWMYLKFRWPASVSAFAFEVGFTNIVTTKTTQCVSALTAAAVPTVGNGLTNGVLFCMDTAFTLTTPALVGIGTSIAATGVKFVQHLTTTAYTPTAAKWVDLYIQATVGGGYCEIYEDDALINRMTVESGPDTAIALFPYISFRDHSTSKVIHLNVAQIIAERNTR